MPRWLVWLPAAVALAGGVAALPLLGTPDDSPAGRSATDRRTAPRVVVLSRAGAATPTVQGPLSAPSAPEIVVAGDVAPARSAPAPRTRTRASAAPERIIEEIVYVDAPYEPEPAAAPAPVTPDPEPAAVTLPAPPAGPAPAAAPASRSGRGSGDVARRAAIGAGLGAILGGGRGAIRGAAGAIGGRGAGRTCPGHFDVASTISR